MRFRPAIFNRLVVGHSVHNDTRKVLFNSSNPNLYQYEKFNLCTRCLTHNSTLKLDYALYMKIFRNEIFRQHFKW